MNIDVIFSAREVIEEKVKDKIVVVIDVLRATSVMVTAFENGVREIRAFESIDETIKNHRDSKEDKIICGERKGIKVEGFDYGNSPLEYDEKVRGKVMYMTTSNGTKAIARSKSAEELFIGAYLNLETVVESLCEKTKDIVLVCAGTDGEYSLDDALCAGMIVERVRDKIDIKITDAAISVLKLAENSNGIHETLTGSKHYSYLKKIGFIEDLNYCLTLNNSRKVPIYRDGIISIYI